mmetsp:Transcript_17371/g.52169  ORF Transcript_17371/g.52169 Transcript_17371/m.52169 type:complete len:109 (-) Transcript_17371:460-786(-)
MAHGRPSDARDAQAAQIDASEARAPSSAEKEALRPEAGAAMTSKAGVTLRSEQPRAEPSCGRKESGGSCPLCPEEVRSSQADSETASTSEASGRGVEHPARLGDLQLL